MKALKEFTGTKSHKKTERLLKGHTGTIIKTMEPLNNRVLIGIPVTGLVRIEWVMGRYGQVVPCNCSHSELMQFLDQYSPLGFMVADARNLIASKAVEGGFEWVLFIDHDTVPPPHMLLTFNEYMLKGEVPVFCGLYFTKGVPSEPLVYRGSGTSYYRNWKLGDKVWVDGIPMGCTMIHTSLLKIMYHNSESYNIGGTAVKKIFQTPARVGFDPQAGGWCAQAGTEDLFWCDRVVKEEVLKKAGWKDIAKKKYPFLIDTNVFCHHIDNSGVMFPSRGEERQFLK